MSLHPTKVALVLLLDKEGLDGPASFVFEGEMWLESEEGLRQLILFHRGTLAASVNPIRSAFRPAIRGDGLGDEGRRREGRRSRR